MYLPDKPVDFLTNIQPTKESKMKKGFTLLELIVVIIIVGVLATLGVMQYTRVVERGRTAEAKSNLGMLRDLEVAYYQERGAYATTLTDMGADLPTVANTSYFFNYACNSNGTCTADRNNSGGKTPDVLVANDYVINLTISGNMGGTTGYY